MIKYKLLCRIWSYTFSSWFASSNEYEKLKKLKYIDCTNCNSQNVEKDLMSPNIVNSKRNKYEKIRNQKYNKIQKKISEYQKFIKQNFDYVGENFAYEARSIHYKDKKNSKGIYGSATKEEIKELKEEGIETEMIPWVKDSNN
jgi:hypothetical protein